MTLTYFTAASVRRNRIEDLNARLRRLHLTPRPPGQSARVDAVKTAVIAAAGLARQARTGIAGATTRGGIQRKS